MGLGDTVTEQENRRLYDIEKEIRRAANAATFIAWVVGVWVVLSIIAGIIIGVQVAKVNSNLTGGGGGNVSNCMSLGGSDPSC